MSPKNTDIGECRIFSQGFNGIEYAFRENNGQVHILMIHGIGRTFPGYASGLVESLSFKMGLNIKSKQNVNIKLQGLSNPKTEIGSLKIYYSSNEDKSKEMYFYEYTWSDINDPIKERLNFDTSSSSAEKRTTLSSSIKNFINETGSDAIIYLGQGQARTRVREGVAQSVCWMMTESWMDSGSNMIENKSCTISHDDKPKQKDYIAITHSLGSQIAIDTLQDLASGGETIEDFNAATDFVSAYMGKVNIEIFMFANQLPAIALGKRTPRVTDKIDLFCNPNSKEKSQRMLQKMDIIAFSDPNDVLSYTLPEGFEETNFDSRLCPEISNVIINVAPLTNLLGTVMANPFEAHSNYQKDDRVLDLIIYGTDKKYLKTKPNKGCYWVKEVVK